MVTVQEKLAGSLVVLKEYQDEHADNLVIQGASTFGMTHTKRLVNIITVISKWSSKVDMSGILRGAKEIRPCGMCFIGRLSWCIQSCVQM